MRILLGLLNLTIIFLGGTAFDLFLIKKGPVDFHHLELFHSYFLFKKNSPNPPILTQVCVVILIPLSSSLEFGLCLIF